MKIEKQSYSVNPWRLVTDEGRQVAVIDAATGIQVAISGSSKQACIAMALRVLGNYITQEETINKALAAGEAGNA